MQQRSFETPESRACTDQVWAGQQVSKSGRASAQLDAASLITTASPLERRALWRLVAVKRGPHAEGEKSAVLEGFSQ